MRTFAPFVLVACATASAAACAASVDATPDNYRQRVKELQPGDTLALAPGEYREGLLLHNIAGEPDRPITITGPAQGTPATFIARALHNTVSIVDAEHLIVRNLVLDGGGLPVDAVKCERPSRRAHHITLENLVIRGHGNNQGTVAISTKCVAWNWVIRGNMIVGAGTGMYLGDSDGSAPFVAGVIERNLIVDTIGYNLQIKHQVRRPDIPGMPSGLSVTVIRHNVFSKADGGSTTAPRPNVLVGHFPPDGAGLDDRYAVYGNFFFQNPNEALFQGEGNVALYSNLFVNAHGDAIHIQPHNDIPKRIDIAHNTVIATGTGISIVPGEGSARYAQSVVANAVYAGIAIAGIDPAGNVTGPFDAAASRLMNPLAPPGQLDLRPRSRSPNGPGANPPNPGALPDWDRDFNGRLRTGATFGAYPEGDAKPGWLPALTLKPE